MKYYMYFLVVFITSNVLIAQPGSFDVTFGTGGKVTTNCITDRWNRAYCLAMQTDGKILAAGVTFSSNILLRDFALVRYNVNGTLDNSFGTGGIVMTDFNNSDDVAYGMALQSDGKIVVAGITTANGISADYAVARYNSDGTLDNTFGNNGLVTSDLNDSTDVALALAIQSDGKIVVAGVTSHPGNEFSDFSLVRYNTNGTLDNSFGTNGVAVTNFGNYNDDAYTMAIQTDGKIIIAGSISENGSDFYFALARFNTNGTLDNTFGTGGKVKTVFNGSFDEIYSIAIQTDGKIVAAGSSFNDNYDDDFAMARYNTNGSLDNSFGTGGKVITPFSSEYDEQIYSIAIQSDGKILAAGYSSSDGYYTDFAMARYNSNGTLDNTFGTAGKTSTDFFSDDDEIQSLCIQKDGKIAVAGFATTTSFDEDFAVARYLSGLSVIADFSAENTPVFIYPNPITSNSVLEYEITDNRNISINLYDMQGKIIQNILQNQPVETGKHKVALPFSGNLPHGNYIISLDSDKGSIKIKVIY